MFANFPDVVDVSGLRTMLGGIGEQKAYELVKYAVMLYIVNKLLSKI